MALSAFEIAMGGITSIPVVGGLIFLGYKSFEESSLDASKLKPKQKTTVKKEAPALDKKEIKEKAQQKNTKLKLTSQSQTKHLKAHRKTSQQKEILIN